jgi:2-dehydro-3-deoxygluconokinase
MEKLDVVAFGEAMVMFMANEYGSLEDAEQYTRTVAGAEINVVVGLARLGYCVGWISRTGADPFGRYIYNFMKQAGVDTTRIIFDKKHPTGLQLKSHVREGDPEIVYFRKSSSASFMLPNAEDDSYVQQARHLHVTGIPAALSEVSRGYTHHLIEVAREADLSISFDPHLRPMLWRSETEMCQEVNDLASKSDWVFSGLDEGQILTGYTAPEDIADFYLEKGIKLVAIKMGRDGASLFTASQCYTAQGFAVRVVDTVGAGDGFAVGIISGMLDGLPLEQCLERGNAIGALAVAAPGDQDGLPRLKDLKRFLLLSHIKISNGA